MNASSPRRLRIRRFSYAVAMICALLTLLTPLFFFIYALLAPTETLLSAAGLTAKAAETAEASRLVFAIVALIAALPLSYGLLRLGACFRGFAEDALFAASTIAGLRDFAGIMLFWAVLQPFLTLINSLILTWSAPPGGHELSLKIASDDILLAVFALCVLIVSWVLTEASALSEEIEQFV
jgi:hypothetical protein